jgi:hypothetical protein
MGLGGLDKLPVSWCNRRTGGFLMANKIITVEIDNETGNLTVDTDGYEGKGCAAVQEAFAATLGKSTHSVNKPEFNKVPSKTTCITR